MRTTYCGLVSEALMGQTVTLMGWAHRRRDHGGVIFIDLRDREGLVQIVFNPDRVATFRLAESLRSEYVISVTGVVRLRPEGGANPNLASGEIEVLVDGKAPIREGAGSYFGEIALLRDVPRTATVRAATDVELYALDRDDFLPAVTGHAGSVQAAESVIGTRLGMSTV